MRSPPSTRRTARACSRRGSRSAWRTSSSGSASRSTSRRRCARSCPRRRARRPGRRPRRLGGARDRGLHGLDPRPPPPAAADELVDDRDRAALAGGDRGDRLGRRPRRSTTSRTRTSTSSAPRTTGSRSAVAACPTGSGRAPTGTARSRRAPSPASSAGCAQLFPAAAEARVDHGWSGVLGVPRDWQFAVGADPERRVAWSGGYVGVGVAAANLGGRIVADLVRGERSDLVDAAVRRPRLAPRLGAGAAALPRRHRDVRALPHRRSAGGRDGAAVAAGGDRERDHGSHALRPSTARRPPCAIPHDVSANRCQDTSGQPDDVA